MANIACRADALVGCYFLIGFLSCAAIVRRSGYCYCIFAFPAQPPPARGRDAPHAPRGAL